MNSLKSAVQDELKAIPEAEHSASLERCASLYTQTQTADALYLIEEGLIKLTRLNEGGGKIILVIRGPGQLVGEECLAEATQPYYTEAVVLTAAKVVRIPREAVLRDLQNSSHLAGALVNYALNGKFDLAEKVELLCLHDVEYRILHYLGELANLLPAPNGETEHRIPITQLELADLIGATRETTSTTLNQLERRGLVKLSRRLLTVRSLNLLKGNLESREAPETAAQKAN